MDRRAMLNLPGGFGKVEGIRKNASDQLKRDRHVRRTMTFNHRRNINVEDAREAEVLYSQADQKVENRKLALQKYKEEKEARKKAIKGKQKPPFKVGIPHHGLTPVLRELTNENLVNRRKNLNKNEPEVRRITRATTREGQKVCANLITAKEIKNNKVNQKIVEMCKAPLPVQVFPFKNQKSVFNFQANKCASTKKLTSPQTPTVMKRSVKKMPLGAKQREHHRSLISKKTKPSKSSVESVEALAAPLPLEVLEDEVFMDDRGMLVMEGQTNKIENLSETPLLSPKKELIDENLPRTRRSQEIVTPSKMDFIAVKEEHSSPKEELSRNLAGSSDVSHFISKVCTQRGKKASLKNKIPDSKSSPEPERIKEVALQRGRLDEETGRLLGFAEHWEVLALQEDLPTEVKDEVDSVVGQTKLLARDKFNQFRGLIDQFENKEGQRPITVDDLNGFWDMIYLQVEVLTNKYGKLQALRENNWVEKVELKMKAQVTRKSKRLPQASSGVRKFLHAKRAKTVESCNENPEGLEQVLPMSATKSVTAQLSMRGRIRSNSPSPYIAMRLSGAGRPSLSSVQVEAVPNATPKSILRLRETPKIDSLKKETSFIVSPGVKNQEKMLEKAPRRRSMRLINKTPTPMKNRLCSMCASPECRKCECVNTEFQSGIKSRRKILPQDDQPDVSFTEKTHPVADDASQPSSSGTRFVLQPSRLDAVVHHGAIPKTRMSRRIKERESKALSPSLESSVGNSRSSRKAKFNPSGRNGTPN